MKLNTRREIIEIWKDQPDEMLDKKTCPYCRDILYIQDDLYICGNSQCKGFIISKEKVV